MNNYTTNILITNYIYNIIINIKIFTKMKTLVQLANMVVQVKLNVMEIFVQKLL